MQSVRGKLSVMMFLQYFTWGAWGTEIGQYMDGRGFSGVEVGSIFSTTAIAAMLSPLFMGILADKLFSTEKLLAALHLIGAALLAAAAMSPSIAQQMPSFSEPTVLWGIMILYALCYMPTLALTNSISFENIASAEKEFPLIRVWGTWGWIIAGWVVGFLLRPRVGSFTYPLVTSIVSPESSLLAPNNFLYLSAISSAVLGLFCLTLPHTPPKSKRTQTAAADAGDRRGILSLLSDPAFMVFLVCSFLICIPLSFYYNLANIFLGQIDAPAPTALQTVGQISEVFFMAVMPWCIMRLGVKKMLAVGMLAWVVRYLFFGAYELPGVGFPLVVLGLILHGVCYDFFFVASQIYVDNRVDVSQRASAQSFIAFVTLGVGMFIGAYCAGTVKDWYPPAVQVAALDAAGSQLIPPVETPLPAWDDKAQLGLAKELNLQPTDTLQASQVPATFVDDTTKNSYTYSNEEITGAIKEITGGDSITRPQWRAAQQNEWTRIWMWPAAMAGATLVMFWALFSDARKAP